MKKVIFHIGHAKTATTSIQHTLNANRSILDDNGFLYLLPKYTLNCNHNQLLVTLFQSKEDITEDLTFMQGIDLKSIDRLKRNYGEWFGRNISSSSAHTLIISAEYLPQFSEGEIQSMREYFESLLGKVKFEVIMFTRDPHSFAHSAYQQRSKRRGTSKVKFFSYATKIPAFIRVFGSGCVNAYKFEDACANDGGPVCFFLEKAGLSEALICQLKILRRNEGISDVAVDVLDYINANIPFTAENIKSGLRRRGDILKFERLPGRKFQLPPEDTRDLRTKTRESMLWLEKTFGIVYEEAAQGQVATRLDFEDAYVADMLVALKRSRPAMRKLIYNYIQERETDESLDVSSLHNLRILERHIMTEYPWSVKLSYRELAFVYRLLNPLLDWLRKFPSVRWLRSLLPS